jgi:replicative DNA helicase
MQIARNIAGSLLAESQAIKQPSGHVHIFSLEMTAQDLATVNLASITRWTSDQIRAGDIGDDKAWIELDRAVSELGRLPIIIDDQAEMDLATLRMRALATKRQKRTRLICIDYRELIRRGRDQARMTMAEWIPYLGYQLKALAKVTNCPVVALAQINKAKFGDAPVRPTLDDLPYDVGQAADAVFALHRPEMYMAEEPPPLMFGASAEKQSNRASEWKQQRQKVHGLAEFIALKRRFGPKGLRTLHFDGPRMLLSERSNGLRDDLNSDLERSGAGYENDR